MIPDSPLLFDSLTSLVLGTYAELPFEEKEIVCKPVIGIDHEGEESTSQEIAIGLTKKTKISLDALIKRIEDELIALKHFRCTKNSLFTRHIAIKVIAFSMIFSNSPDETWENLIYILDSISASRVSLYYIIPGLIDIPQIFSFGEYSYGKLNMEHLEFNCTHSGSNYLKLWGDKLENRLTITREMSNVNVFSLGGSKFVGMEYVQEKLDVLHTIGDAYHADLASQIQVDFKSDFIKQQAVISACKAGEVTIDIFDISSGGCKFITVFNREEPNQGWVKANHFFPQFEYVDPNYVTALKDKIFSKLRLEDWRNLPLDEYLEKYFIYLQASNDHTYKNRKEEALLHIVFALDLLLGGKKDDALTKVLAERVGFIYALSLNEDLDATIKFISDTYNMRSGYAHRGERGGLDIKGKGKNKHIPLSERLEITCKMSRVIIAAACWARKQNWCNSRDDWLARIDLLRANRNANESLDAGIKTLGLDLIKQRDDKLGFEINWPKTEES